MTIDCRRALRNAPLEPGSARHRWRLALPLAGAALAACGGGGGGPAPIDVALAARVEAASAGSNVDAANYRAYAPLLAQLVLTSTGSGFLGGAVAAGAAPLAREARLARERAQTRQTTTLPCPAGGTLVVTVDDVNGDGKLNGGDSAEMAFGDCRLDATLGIDGTVSLAILRSELDADGFATALEADGTLTELTEGTLATLNGPFRLTQKECVAATGLCGHQRISFRDATAVHAGQTGVLRLDVLTEHGATISNEISGAVGIGGEFYTLQPMAGERFEVASYGALPTSGRMRLQDAAGDALQIQARAGDRVDFSFHPQGSTAPAEVWPDQPWSDFQ